MSHGTITDDKTHTVVTDIGSGWVGFYQKKIFSGDNDPLRRRENTYVMSLETKSDSVIRWVPALYPDQIRTATYESLIGGITASNPVWDENDEIDLVNKLGTCMKGHSFSAGNSIGAEGKDALKQIAGAADALYNGLKKVKSLNPKGSLGELKKLFNPNNKGLGKWLSGNTLATQLGWLPMISDMNEAYKALRNVADKPLKVQCIAKARKIGFYHPDGVPAVKCGEIVLNKRLAWTLSEGPLDVFDYYDLNDPYSVIYAGTPLSFMLDWILPIGNYLSARKLSQILIGSGVMTTFIKGRAATLHNTHNPGYILSISGQPYTRSDVSVLRTPLTVLDVPVPTIKGFDKIPSWRRALTTVGLLGQALL